MGKLLAVHLHTKIHKCGKELTNKMIGSEDNERKMKANREQTSMTNPASPH
jgi:hypothetical protein